MSKQIQISALMDGEDQTPEAIDTLCLDQPMQAQWQRHHLIRDVMQGEAMQFDIAASVAAALEDEPAHQGVAEENVVPLQQSQPTPVQAKRSLPSWFSNLAQMGVAACVSLAVVLGVQYSGQGDMPQAVQSAEPVLHTVPFFGSAEPVSLNLDAEQTSDAQHIQMEDQQRRRIHSLMQDHELQLRLHATPVMEQEIGATAQ
ncbi:Anti-sigma-E factor RseA [Vibrio stylophorae]|uniref:Anti-sigma-E factor RseA n=1 Tax=Vibrio stylophorae TaxID=659351 RepID=A0ABM8ZVN6_9VIBR|nr:RseA family anti-sigma factor [Vibrio stylophorae]CAH0534371.1 Anti-sigma-E factor RseA [Vibrio stylophorae]